MPPATPPETTSARIVLYARSGCHLCDEAVELLNAVIGPGGYRTVDIESDDDLLVRYGHRIPVIAVDGVDRLEGFITGADLRALVELPPL